MTPHFHVGQCPSCRQGRLFLYRKVITGLIYGHCEECEWGYSSPDELAAGRGFLTLFDPDEAEAANHAQIRRSPWADAMIFVAGK